MLLNWLLGLLFLNYCMALNYDYPVGSEKVCSLPGGLTFLFRQESMQRTDRRRGAEEFPFDTLMLSFPVASEINRPLLWTPLPASPCRFPVLVACRKLVRVQLVPTPTPVGNMIQVYLVACFHLCLSVVSFFVVATLCRIIFPHAVGMVDCFQFVHFFVQSNRRASCPQLAGEGSYDLLLQFLGLLFCFGRKVG